MAGAEAGKAEQNAIDHDISRDYWKSMASGVSGDSLVVTGESQDKMSLPARAPHNTHLTLSKTPVVINQEVVLKIEKAILMDDP